MKKRNSLFCIVLILALLLSACGGGYDSGYYDNGADSDRAPNYEATDDGDYTSDEAGTDSYYPDGPAPAPGVTEDYGDYYDATSGESYIAIQENDRVLTSVRSMLAFSLKVDTASYSNVERYLESGILPPADAVRIEELINYFSYDTPLEFGDAPFALYTEVAPSPFDDEKYLAFLRVKTPDVDRSDLPSTNFTFLIDTSGSMNSHDKLPLLKDSLALLVAELDADDIVSIVTYAGSSEILLDSVSGADKDTILRAIDRLSASGSTAGANGIMTAYGLAEKNFMENGNNRVILCSDGDFNVGMSSLDELQELIEKKRQSGVYLSVLGFGTGNLRDDIMETLAANGNGNYSYIPSLRTAEKVLVEEMAANLFTVADDVKAQVEFNPENVHSYRLIGYENRQMSNQEFLDDQKDAGEIGAGTDIVMMFELELTSNVAAQGLKYASESPSGSAYSNELFEVRIRYKQPGTSTSHEIVEPVSVASVTNNGSSDFGFACSVAAFGHLLRGSDYAGSITLDEVTALAKANLGRDEAGHRLEYLMLLRQYESTLRDYR